ncbi:M-phase inducer phosphatase 2-like isoform X2 [Dysidea avara]|uniref:M-phase inducer phosphatase 2-like isoform X2 n=1 Tax=Dysidea avara TaxID=196820 RepID=UPI00331E3920
MDGRNKPVTSVFSPGMELGTPNEEDISCLTPRRRLSLDKQEKSPPVTDNESGFCSWDGVSPTVDGGSLSSLDSVFLGSSIGKPSNSSMVGGGPMRRCIKQARRASRLRCSSSSSDNKENQETHKSDGVFKMPIPLPFHDRPVSLPSFPLSPMEDSSYKQINSPFDNLVLSSPPSDGFDPEVLSEATNEESPPLQSLGALLMSPTTQFVNAVNSPTVLKPTPVRPKPCLFGKQLHRQLSVSSVDDHQHVIRPPKRYILSPHHESAAKKTPSSFTESLPGNSTSISPRQQQQAVPFVRSYSCVVRPHDTPTQDEDELIGDQSKPYCLPIERGASPPDLKCISPQTVADVLSGSYSHLVNSYTIVDCRFPYEHNGGHIKGAINIWNKDDLLKYFLPDSGLQHSCEGYRNVYIFHCEFSSKRGPGMLKFLREMDRKRNGLADFPKLYYPELYLAHGGYKSFYEQFPKFCEPEEYCTMIDDNHKEEYRHFSERSKSWSGETKKRCPSLGRRRHTFLGDHSTKCTASRQL